MLDDTFSKLKWQICSQLGGAGSGRRGGRALNGIFTSQSHSLRVIYTVSDLIVALCTQPHSHSLLQTKQESDQW